MSTHKGLLKIGFTDRDAQTRIKDQLGTATIPYKIVFEESAMKRDGSSFTDHEVHRLLREWKVLNENGEWFKCTLSDLRRAIHQIKTGEKTINKNTGGIKSKNEWVHATFWDCIIFDEYHFGA
ncbi:GIY-YIG nuclease family protein [Pedobacter glucosidilyticus]|uniref:GIY-YIG nuclease family protein n=1 Tax=Pedobacter glucosidilyticus TaxID=1122941 RepID=UPI001B7FA2C5